MKIAFLSASVSRKSGGLFDANRRVAQELIKLGSHVESFGISDDRCVMDQADWLPVASNIANSYGPRQLGYSPRLTGMITNFSPDVLHSHGLWLGTSAVAKAWGKRSGRPVIIHPHGMMDPWALRNSSWKKRFAGWLFERDNLRLATCIRALCDSEAVSIRKFGLTNPIAVIPNGVDPPAVAELKQNSDEQPILDAVKTVSFDDSIYQATGVAPASKKLLYLGRLHPKKGIVNLLRAWSASGNCDRSSNKELTSANMPWQLWIAGWDEGGHEGDLKQLATNLDIDWCDVRHGRTATESASVVFLGPQFKNDKSRCYEICDAFVLPSYSEGLPMVILEAWAYGKPVLMTPHCNLPEGFSNESAIEIETTVESIVEGLRRLTRLTDSERISIGNRGRQLVRQKFTWEKVAAQVHDVSHWAIHGGTPPDCIRFD